MAVEDERGLTSTGGTLSPVVQQFIAIYQKMPLSRKIAMATVVLLVIAGFIAMFFWANKIDYQTVYTGLADEDAADVVEKLNEQNIPYLLTAGGKTIKVPAEKVYDVRLSLAASGLPRGGVAGYELFDEMDFGTTEFVQKLNYQRALQGELARTIRQFHEVDNARVMIVLPKDSVFLEESKPPSASVLLKLKGDLTKEKVDAVVHLVSSAVEGMEPNLVTVVDTKGNVLFRGVSDDNQLDSLANSQLQYKLAFEKNLAGRIQTMLEGILGNGKAIVRVTADMSFDQVDINEELFDPDVQIIRSRQSSSEASEKTDAPGNISSVNPIAPGGQGEGVGEPSERQNRQDETVNYELNRTVRRTIKPVGQLQRLSVAAVLDGTYVDETDESGNPVRKFVPRSQAELGRFITIVKNAMGYNEDREDQVTVESFPFSYMEDLEQPEFSWKSFLKQYGRSFINIFLVLLLFVFIVLPLVKSMKEIKTTMVESLPAPKEKGELAGPDVKTSIPSVADMTNKQKAIHFANQDMEKTANILRKWVAEAK